MSRTAIFTDSTLRPSQISHLPETKVFPAAVMGDIYKLDDSFKRIILIDGVFLHHRPVWQRELLYKLNTSTIIYGVSSMGALRAAELRKYGMIGHGWIYDQYSTNCISCDDEVAFLYGVIKDKVIKVTYPMVEIRWMFIAENLCIKFPDFKIIEALRSLKTIGFSHREISTIRDILAHHHLKPSVLDRLLENLSDGLYDIKKFDAISLLSSLYPNFTLIT